MAAEVYSNEIRVDLKDTATPKMSMLERRVQQQLKTVERYNSTPMRMTMTVVDRATRVIDSVTSRALRMARTGISIPLRIITSPVRALWNAATGLPGMLGLGLGGYGAARGGVMSPLGMADELTRANLGFETMLGSAAKAQDFMAQVQQFAIDTPFQTEGLIKDANLLLALKWDADQVIPSIQAIGDAMSAMGGSEAQIENVIVQLGQMRMKGRVSAEEMTTLAENNINAWQYVADSMGLSVQQVRALSEAGKLQAEPAIAAIIKGMDKAFGGSMARNANKTAGGLWSQIWDMLKINTVTRWGQGIQSVVIPALKEINDWLGANKETVKGWGDALEGMARGGASWVIQKMQDLKGIVDRLSSSPAFRNADFFGKIRIAWDEIIGRSFETWWSGEGEAQVTAMAFRMGTALGGIAGGVLSGLFGLAQQPAFSQGQFGRRQQMLMDEAGANQWAKQTANPFVEAGSIAGVAFFDAFLNAFDAGKLADKAAQTLKDRAPGLLNLYMSNLPKPLGDADLNPLSALTAYGGFKVLQQVANTIPGRETLAGWLGRLPGQGSRAAEQAMADATQKVAAAERAAAALDPIKGGPVLNGNTADLAGYGKALSSEVSVGTRALAWFGRMTTFLRGIGRNNEFGAVLEYYDTHLPEMRAMVDEELRYQAEHRVGSGRMGDLKRLEYSDSPSSPVAVAVNVDAPVSVFPQRLTPDAIREVIEQAKDELGRALEEQFANMPVLAEGSQP